MHCTGGHRVINVKIKHHCQLIIRFGSFEYRSRNNMEHCSYLKAACAFLPKACCVLLIHVLPAL